MVTIRWHMGVTPLSNKNAAPSFIHKSQGLNLDPFIGMAALANYSWTKQIPCVLFRKTEAEVLQPQTAVLVFFWESVDDIFRPQDDHVLAAWTIGLVRKCHEQSPKDVVQKKHVDDKQLAHVVVLVNERLEVLVTHETGHHE